MAQAKYRLLKKKKKKMLPLIRVEQSNTHMNVYVCVYGANAHVNVFKDVCVYVCV